MVSDFLVMHESGPFFQLNLAEYEKALKNIERSVSASIHVGSDAYFDNSSLLAQFERLFKLLDFKESFKNNKIEIIVDSARTHSVRTYSLLDFGNNISTRCPVNYLEWIDDTVATQALSCYFQHGSNKGKSKGLFETATELKCHLSPGITLNELHQLLSHHPAFQNVILSW